MLLPLTSVAAVGPLRWYLDGKPQPGAVAVTLDSGEHELIAVDRRQGCLDRAVFSVE